LQGLPFDLSTAAGASALNIEAGRQASMVAYVDVFYLMTFICIAATPLLLLVRRSRSPAESHVVAE
ncbi:MAG: EmrB/QacA family drug resistance transporter, partial [Caulobacteraceae bacterium]